MGEHVGRPKLSMGRHALKPIQQVGLLIFCHGAWMTHGCSGAEEPGVGQAVLDRGVLLLAPQAK